MFVTFRPFRLVFYTFKIETTEKDTDSRWLDVWLFLVAENLQISASKAVQYVFNYEMIMFHF